jgi:hypothetical protein
MASPSSLRGFCLDYPRFATQTKELRAEIHQAIAAIPEVHRLRPATGETYATPDEAYTRIKDWGFTQGMLLVKESANNKTGRWRIECSRYHEETRNSRKMGGLDKQRLDTHSEAYGCKFALYVSRRKRQNNQWVIGWTNETHNHVGLADPFSHPDLRVYRPHHQLARQLASSHRGTLSYTDSAEVLRKQGLKIEQREFYNLTKKERKQDPSEAENTTKSTDSEEEESESSEESSGDRPPSVLQLAELTGERPIRKRRQRKDYTKILPPSSVSLRPSRKHSKKFDSQNQRDIAAKAAKEEHRKAREAKANRTGTGRTKKQEALAIASQLVDTQLMNGIEVELPLRSSQ